jgi:transcriptional regulator with XRE-family HTH domain
MKKVNLVPIGNNIRLWRILKGFKQMEFAKKLAISKSTISKIENDEQEVGAQRLQQMAHILNINVTQLFVDPSSLLPPPRIVFELTTANKLALNYPRYQPLPSRFLVSRNDN